MYLGLVVVTVTCVSRMSLAAPVDRETAKLVAEMVPQYHINRPAIDDAASAALLDTYLKDLDPLHLYFTQADVKTFNSHRTTLDDELRSGDVNFAYQVYKVYKQRVHQQCDNADKLIDADVDFTLDETKPADYAKLDWAKDDAELSERWRKMIKFELLLNKVQNEDLAKNREDLHKRYRNLRRIVDQRDDIDQLEIYLSSFTRCFDPHSSYMSPQSWEDFEIDLKLSLDGIGAALRGDDGNTVVADIVPNGAAAQDGRLKVGDKITGVGQVNPATGKPSEIVDVVDMKLTNVVRMIRGERGTKVVLRVQPKDATEIKTYEITRAKIELTSQEARGEIIDTQDRVGRPGKIGVVYLPSFYHDFEAERRGDPNYKSVTTDVEKILSNFRKEKVDAVVLDLRWNTGGALSDAIGITGHFIDQGPVVQVRESESSGAKVLDDDLPGTLWNGPLVLICNRMSASASEIFAGAIKDYHRGVIVGDTTTHGKGTVQNLMDVSPNQMFRLFRGQDRGKLKLTIQQFYRVNGESTQNKGVVSDIVLPSMIDHADLGESFLDHALPFHTIAAARYVANALVTPELISALQHHSEARVAASEDFKKLQHNIDRAVAKKNRQTVPLNESALRAEREEEDQKKKETADKEAEGDQPRAVKPGAPVFPKDAYNDEVLNITLDYLQVLNNRVTAQSQQPATETRSTP